MNTTTLSDRAAAPGNAPADAAAAPANVIGRSARLLQFAARYRSLADDKADPSAHAGEAEAFAKDIQALGPAFIKIGQSLSIRPDLLPPEYVQALEKLQDKVDTIPYHLIQAEVERELGVKIASAFSHFDAEPLAAASLAQVHSATLRDGREVVVKVQRPGISEAIKSDLAVLSGFARTADKYTEHGKRVQFAEWVAEMSETLSEELDYRLEADNLRVFRKHLESYPRLFVPAPITDFSSGRILTMERAPGSKVTQAVELRRLEQPLGEFASELIHAYLDQIFVHGLVHADPHPGNVMLSEDHLSLVDLGMVVRLSPEMRTGLLKLLAAMVEGDSDTVAAQTVALGERLEMFDERQWKRECSRLIGRFCTRDERTAPGEGALLIELTRRGVQAGLRPPPELAVLGRTLLALETVTRVLDPEASPRQLVREHLDDVLAKRVAQESSLHSLRSKVGEMAEFARNLPRQASEVLDTLAQNRLRVRISGLEESRLLENLQKIANRITVGLICAALVVGAALALRVDAGPKLFGYPAIALVMFVIAFGLSTALVVSVMMSDRHVSRYNARSR